MTTSNTRLFSDLPIPPGENLAEELEARGMTPQELANALDLADHFVAEIIRGERPITDDIAIGLEQHSASALDSGLVWRLITGKLWRDGAIADHWSTTE